MEIRVWRFQNYRDCGYTCNPHKFEIPALRFPCRVPAIPCKHLQCRITRQLFCLLLFIDETIQSTFSLIIEYICANNRIDYYIDRRRASKLPYYNINYVAITIRKSLSIVAKIAFFTIFSLIQQRIEKSCYASTIRLSTISQKFCFLESGKLTNKKVLQDYKDI